VEDNRVMPGEDDDMEDDRVTPREDDDVDGDEEEALGSDASALPSVYLRGTASLPPRPIPPYRCPKIAPAGEK
jgi:hypothetical protein